MFNPRFPHRLRVWRPRRDEYGDPVTDEKGDALFLVASLDKVIVVDGMPMRDIDGGFVTEQTEWLSFGYRTSSKNTRDSVDVMVSDFKLATPMFLTPLEPGDRVEIEDYDRSYLAEVVRKQTTNFGSNIWINEIKN